MRKKINCKVIQSRRLDRSHASRDVRAGSSSASGAASYGPNAARQVSAYQGIASATASQVDLYA
jgi:hypothetical protein